MIWPEGVLITEITVCSVLQMRTHACKIQMTPQNTYMDIAAPSESTKPSVSFSCVLLGHDGQEGKHRLLQTKKTKNTGLVLETHTHTSQTITVWRCQKDSRFGVSWIDSQAENRCEGAADRWMDGGESWNLGIRAQQPTWCPFFLARTTQSHISESSHTVSIMEDSWSLPRNTVTDLKSSFYILNNVPAFLFPFGYWEI